MRITISIQEAATASGLSVRKLQYLIGSGVLPSVRIGRRRLIPVRELERFLLRGGKSSTAGSKPQGTCDPTAEHGEEWLG
jgi:excisionase family DNA binding protein